MDENWRFIRFIMRRLQVLGVFFVFVLSQSWGPCWSLNEQGEALLKLKQRVVDDPFGALANWVDDGLDNPCSWNGVECSDGNVVVLNLKDLCLKGTLAPEITGLIHVKSIILRNNSFFGIIPEGMGGLKELELLDLGCNNFSGLLPADLGSNLSLAILLLDNNELLGGLSPEIYELKMLSECQVDENQLSSAARVSSCSRRSVTWNINQDKEPGKRKLLQSSDYRRDQPLRPPPPPPSFSTDPDLTPSVRNIPSPPNPATSPSPASLPTPIPPPSNQSTTSVKSTSSNNNNVAIVAGVIGGTIFLVILIIGIYLCKTNKVATVGPWATGLSGQLQKAFITGVPKLKRSELEAACEDFSNVISTSPIGNVYKGTLSSGVEIAVASITETSSKNWPKNTEAQFRRKIDTLSMVNHKNFVNLLGYCNEEEPFTRMLVFEYAPNGTLFEHIHIKESEHLDWGMRLRIAMGMAYCLQHMHQLDPPFIHSNLTSSIVSLTEDYAAKISDLSFWNEITSAEKKAPGRNKTKAGAGPESNVYSFGVILFEMVTGRLPYSVDSGSLEHWASGYLGGDQPLHEMVDPTLDSFKMAQLEQLSKLIRSCVKPNPSKRPTMKEVCGNLRDITGITPEGAAPKLSPLWWAELEILSADGS